MEKHTRLTALVVFIGIVILASESDAWNDKTHLAVSKAAGYGKWYNSAGADLAKVKLGNVEGNNHYSNNPPGAIVTAEDVLSQASRYDTLDPDGHLYGAIVSSLRKYRAATAEGKYGEYHLAYCAHYVADLSQPLHNTVYNTFNQENHKPTDRIVDDGVLDNVEKILISPLVIGSEGDLARHIAALANRSVKLGYQLEAENRLPTKAEAYRQLGRSASLLRAILDYAGSQPAKQPAGP